MDNSWHTDASTRAGTIGGTFLVLLLHISGDELIKTALLAAVGAAVSFVVSLVLKYVLKRMR